MKITIVGNMAFLEKFKEAKGILEQRGHEVIVPEKDPIPEPIPPSVKRKAMERFNKNLKKSDAILVMNYTKDDKENHIGANSLMEIGMAFILNKKIFVLNPFPEFCKDELEAIEAQVLNGDLNKIK
jgi:nucleoside 2-deoxyribosyltransferase